MNMPVYRLAGRVLPVLVPVLLLVLSLGGARSRADSIELVNGDHYSGALVSASGSNVVFQSEIQGRLTIPRDKVARINMREPEPARPGMSSNAPAASRSASSSTDLTAAGATGSSDSPGGRTAASTQFSLQYTNRLARLTNAPARPGEAALRQLRREGPNAKAVAQIRSQVLSRAAPEAGDKFDELLGGLVSGRLSLDDLRGQAASSIKNIQEVRGELGPETGLMLDGYLSILQNFLNETEPPPAPKPAVTNKPALRR